MSAETAPRTAQADVLEDILTARHSCRGFRPEPVPDDVVRRMFDLAQRTPSWCNSQAWQVHLAGGTVASALSARLLERVEDGPPAPDIPGPARYEGVYQERRRSSGLALYGALGIGRDDSEARQEQMLANFRFFGAPHLAVISSPVALGTYGVMDCGGYVANLLNAAAALDLGAIAQAAIAMYADTVRDELGIPEDRSVVCGVSFGYADPDHPANSFRTDRSDIDDIVAGLPVRTSTTGRSHG
ncbi:nitroreductase family protein [Aeromicrobium fastidiosum]|uniref:Nitroreductase n=1 Tax=Aeromicrobium fastidiosum TaxID=52699 RepID=A0A641AS71_9ACTN|nr:nitroreductase family protein [Aeromicrobium fastidiosum]KAA1379911.1 nitroreductase [Aeromicrobium fastidiosum]MBP2389417.1 nitroreductase [Aeromicrobium fastidiosum]